MIQREGKIVTGATSQKVILAMLLDCPPLKSTTAVLEYSDLPATQGLSQKAISSSASYANEAI